MSEAGSKLGGLPSLGYSEGEIGQQPVAYNPNAGGIFNDVANAAEAIGKVYQPQLDAAEAAAGARSVTRDANGNLQVAPTSKILPPPEAYENAAQLKYLSESTLDVQTQLGQLRQQFRNDPNGFAAAADGMAAGAVKNAPPQFQEPLQELISKQASAIHQDLITSQLDNQAATAKASTDALYEQNSNQLMDFAFQNNMQNPQAQELLKQNIDIIRAQVGNPVFHLDQAGADLKINALNAAITAQGITGNAIKTYTNNPTMSPATVIMKAVDQLHDPALALSPAEIQTYEGRIRQTVREIHAYTLQYQTAARQAVEFRINDAMEAALTGGQQAAAKVLSPEEITAAYPPDQAAYLIGKINTNAAIYSNTHAVALATPSQLAQMDQQLNPANGPARNTPLIDLIPSLERSADNAVSPKGAVGRYQILPSTAQEYGGDPAQLTNPQYSKALASVILDDLQMRFGDPDAALVGYNAGPGWAQRFIDAGKDTSILPTETQDYLNRAHGMGLGTDYAGAAREYEAFEKAVNARNTALKTDPAGYMMPFLPDVAAQIASGDPATRQAGVRSLLAWQRDIGVPAGKMAVLPKDQADQLASQLSAGSPDNAVAVLQAATNGLSSDQLQILAQQVAPKNRAYAAAIAAVGQDPGMAANMLIGERYLSQNPDARPTEKQIGPAVDAITAGSTGWFSNTGGLFQYAPDARATAVAGATALYARSLIGGKSTGFDQRAFQTAFNQVVGTPINFRGQIIVAPKEGLSRSRAHRRISPGL